MPTTSVANSSGAMMVLISRRKMSASTRRCVATTGPVVPDLRSQQHGDEDPGRQRPPDAAVGEQQPQTRSNAQLRRS